MTDDQQHPREQDLPGLAFRGPYLAMAVLCEKLLKEADGLISVIRIVDRITITGSGPDAPMSMPTVPVNFVALIGFKSGTARGSFEVEVRMVSPSQRTIYTAAFPILLEGEDRGANLELQMNFPVDEDGLYWLEVSLSGSLVTRVPLRVLYQRMSVSRGPGT